jgi:tetratricopeptide (TPR) repeat protein
MKMTLFKHVGFLIVVPVLLGGGSADLFAMGRGVDVPPAARVVLSKISPMMAEKKYPQAIDILLAFQKRGGPYQHPGQSDPKGYHHPEIYYALGNCYLLQERHKAAAEAYRRAVERDKKHTFAWLNLARTRYEMYQYAEAGHCFEQGYATAEKKNPEHLYYAAVAHLMAEKPLRAISIFEKLMALQPAGIKSEWKENLVQAYLAANQPRLALPYIRELAGAYTGEKKIQWQEMLLYQYIQLDMDAAALKLAMALTRENPTRGQWWKALVHIQLKAGRYENALAAMTIYSFLVPLSMEEKKLLADLNLQLGIPVKAAPLLEACLNMKPDKRLLQHLAVAYRQLGRPETALERIDGFAPDTKETDLMLLKAELLYAMKQYDKAATIYVQAAKHKGKHTGRAWLMAGYAAWQMNDIPGSKDAFVKAAGFKEEKKAADSALRNLARLSVAADR